jgi:hypothetical protein
VFKTRLSIHQEAAIAFEKVQDFEQAFEKMKGEKGREITSVESI